MPHALRFQIGTTSDVTHSERLMPEALGDQVTDLDDAHSKDGEIKSLRGQTV